MLPLATRHVWFDGQLVPADVPQLSVYDRGFQIGDGVFEALRAVRGVPIELDGHLARLHDSLAAMEFEIPFSDEDLAAGLADLLAAEGLDVPGDLDAPPGIPPDAGNVVVRITISRGFDPSRNVVPPRDTHASVAIQAWPYHRPPERSLRDGESLVTSAIRRDPDSPMAGVKTISRAELVYARLEARHAGADDAVFLTTDGRIAEATTSNVLIVRGDRVSTPRLGCGLLAGTTRAWLVRHAGPVGLVAAEEDLRPDDVFAADEMAVSASISGVLPVTSLDGRPIGNGRPGPRTLALREARERYIDEVSRAGARGRLGGARRASEASAG